MTKDEWEKWLKEMEKPSKPISMEQLIGSAFTTPESRERLNKAALDYAKSQGVTFNVGKKGKIKHELDSGSSSDKDG
jgi:hypothetical protein